MYSLLPWLNHRWWAVARAPLPAWLPRELAGPLAPGVQAKARPAWPSHRRGFEEPTLLGFNAVRLEHHESTGETKYGDTDNILDDLAALGVTYVRQPTSVDLTWPGAVPVDTFSGANSGAALRAHLDADGLPARLLDLFQRLLDPTSGRTPLKVVFTFLNVAGPVELLDPAGEYHGPVHRSGSMLRLQWADGWTAHEGLPGTYDSALDHRTQTVGWNDAAGTTAYGFADYFSVYGDQQLGSALTLPSGDDFLYGTMDPRSPYKLAYVYLMAKVFGGVLVQTEADFAAWWAGTHPDLPCPSIFDFIEGIELCNEVNTKNIVLEDPGVSDEDASAVLSAVLYMRVVREAIRGFTEGLQGQLVRYWLPSLWSYINLDSAESAPLSTTSTFGYTRQFSAWLALCVARWEHYGAGFAIDYVGSCPTGAPSGLVSRVGIRNQDYHWYHYKEGQAGGLILRLAAEVEELRAGFEAAGLNEGVGQEVTISVSESGASTYDGDVAPEYLDAWGIVYPSVGSDSTLVYRFHADEIWRRVATALAVSHAAAWHTHMSNTERGEDPADPTYYDESSFRDMGVRVDYTAETVDASEAAPRPAWYAFQRLATFLSGRTATGASTWRGRIVVPATLGDWEYYQGVIPAAPGDDGAPTVLEFDRSGAALFPTFPFAYVIFVDPSYIGSGSSTNVGVDFENPSFGEVLSVSPQPWGVGPTFGGSATTFPPRHPAPRDPIVSHLLPAGLVHGRVDLTTTTASTLADRTARQTVVLLASGPLTWGGSGRVPTFGGREYDWLSLPTGGP